MKLNIWQPIILTLVLGACAGPKGPSRAERATQVANIKTQLAIEYMRGGDYRQATVSIEEALKADSSNEDAWLVRAQIYQYLKVRDRNKVVGHAVNREAGMGGALAAAF